MRFYHKDGPWQYRHPEPPRVFRQDMGRLHQFATRLACWQEFLTDYTLRQFERLKGHMISFSHHDLYSTLLLTFECPPNRVKRVINSLLLNPRPFEFKRNDLYDSRAWVKFPLSDFVHCHGRIIARELTYDEKHYQSDVMPMLHFGVHKQPWTVTRNCFSIVRRQEKFKRLAVMVFNHPDQQRGDKEGRWCAEIEIPDGKKPRDMEDELFAKVEEEAAEHYVTVIESATARRLRGESALPMGPQKKN